jgi:hypothetical protein
MNATAASSPVNTASAGRRARAFDSWFAVMKDYDVEEYMRSGLAVDCPRLWGEW